MVGAMELVVTLLVGLLVGLAVGAYVGRWAAWASSAASLAAARTEADVLRERVVDLEAAVADDAHAAILGNDRPQQVAVAQAVVEQLDPPDLLALPPHDEGSFDSVAGDGHEGDVSIAEHQLVGFSHGRPVPRRC